MDLSCFAGGHGLHITMVDKTIVHGKSMMPLSEPNDYHSTVWCLEIFPEMEALRIGPKYYTVSLQIFCLKTFPEMEALRTGANHDHIKFSGHGSPSKWIKSL